MEGSSEKTDGSVITKKLRPLDVPSVAVEKSRISASTSRTGYRDLVRNGESKDFKRSDGSPLASRGSFPLESRKKRSRRVVSLSSFQPFVKRRRNSLNASRPRPNRLVCGIGKPESASSSISGLHDLSNLNDCLDKSGGGPDSLSPEKKDHVDQNVGKSEGFKGLGVNIVIPKRPRGTLKRKKPEGFLGLKRAVHDPTYSVVGEISKLSADIVLPTHLSDGKLNKRFKEFQVSDSSKDSPLPHKEGKKCSSVLVSNTKVRSRKARSSTGEKQTTVGVENSLAVSDEKFRGHPQDDNNEAENLEQNAARMLSSRFDPKCTDFLGRRTTSSLKSTNGSSFSQSFCVKIKGSHSETCSVDSAGRVLRPRQRNGKGFYRKRRHFYEVCSKDVDPYSVLKQRISVFWPLDRSWYFGLVKDYDPATKMHYVQYDDRDEEWLNLQNERIKLLLFPSEINSKVYSEKLGSGSEQRIENGGKNAIDLKCPDGITDSEPIITWLTRSACPLKSSPASIFKKRRRTALMNNPSTLLVRNGHMTMSTSIMSSSKLSRCIVPERLVNGNSGAMPLLKSKTRSDGKSVSFVYSRRRFHSRREGMENTTPEKVFACQTLVRRISILSSVADEEVALEELDSFVLPLEPKQVMLKLMVPLESMQDISSPANTFWLCHAIFLLHYGKLMPLWTMVRMEAVFVDNVMGLRFLAFEGCLRRAIGLICYITTTFRQRNEGSKFVERKMPSTSVGFKFSGLHDQRRGLLFVFSFSDIDNSKWRCLEDKLEQHCLKIRELAFADCTSSHLKNLPSGATQMLHNLFRNDLVSYKALPENSCSDITDRLTFNEYVNMNVNPAVCLFPELFGVHRSRSLSFASASSCSLSLHLKLLMEKKDISCDIQKAISVPSEECPVSSKLIDYGCSPAEYTSDQVSEIILEKVSKSRVAESTGWFAFAHPKVENDTLSLSTDCNGMRSFNSSINAEGNITQNRRDLGGNESDWTISELRSFPCNVGSFRGSKKSGSSSQEDSSSPDKSEGGFVSSLNVDSQIQQCGQVEEQSFTEGMHTTNIVCEINEHTPNTTAQQRIWHNNQQNSVLHTFDHPDLWREDFLTNGFFFSSKKPRTRVSYSEPFENYEVGTRPRSHHRKRQIYKKIGSDNTKRISSVSGNHQSCYLESLICDANVLVTVADRGWRESGAMVVLDSCDKKDWTISVKISGDTKYVHKANQLLQPGATNRYTHAMMWRGGKDWTLEFTDRRQWSLFKEMYEECFNRNLRAASVKNIPTPGVRLIEDADENFVEVPFVRNSHKYIRQIGTDVDIASDPSYVLYDMDSSDEEWIANLRCSLDSKEGILSEVTDDMFERVMDTFEKFAYAQSCDEFTNEEIEEYMSDVGPLDVIKAIHEHWRKKRQKKGLPLIRQFQPSLWELYEQQLEEWESALRKMHSLSDGSQYRTCFPQKPPMFAFCFRPRGLEMPNKGSKQRSHKKFMLTGHHNAFARDMDGFHAFDRKLDGHFIGDDEALVVGTSNYEYTDLFHWHQSLSGLSPRDAIRVGTMTVTSDGGEGSHHPMLSRSYSRKVGMLWSSSDSSMKSFADNYKAKGNGVNNAHLFGRPSTKQSRPDGFLRHQADVDEFRLRDASSAAQHASNMAKLKKEKAHWLLRKADLALHKATVALITAELISASEQDGDG